MILYGIFTETSIGALFVAGVIPGVLSALVYIVMITARAVRTPDIAPRNNAVYTVQDKKSAYKDIWPLPVLICGVLVGIFTGTFSPTEAGAIGAGLAIIIALVRRSLSAEVIKRAMIDTAIGTSTIFIVAIGASMFAAFMSLSTLPSQLGAFMLSSLESPMAIILTIALMVIVLGMFVDGISLLLLTIPIVMPVLNGLNVDMIWFGILMIKMLEIGLITPPVGMNVYVIKSSLGNEVELNDIFKGVWWFLLMDVLVLVMIIIFPSIALFLPSLML